MVVTVRPVAKSVPVFERDGAGVTCTDNWQPSQDRGCRNHVNNLLPRKGFIDQPRTTLSNPRLCVQWRLLIHVKARLYTLTLTGGLQFDIVEKGNVGTLKLYGVIPTIDLDGEREKKLQTTIPDVVGFERKLLHTRGADEDTVLPVVTTILLIWKWPALQTLHTPVNRVSDLQGSEQTKVSFAKHCLAHLNTELNSLIRVCTYCVLLLHVEFIYLESPEQIGDVDWLEHGVHVETASVRGKCWQIQARKPAGMVLVQEIGQFLREIT